MSPQFYSFLQEHLVTTCRLEEILKQLKEPKEKEGNHESKGTGYMARTGYGRLRSRYSGNAHYNEARKLRSCEKDKQMEGSEPKQAPAFFKIHT